MKITFAFTALVALATTISALPAEPELSTRADAPACTAVQFHWLREHYFSTIDAARDDRHAFRLIVRGATPPFDETLPYKKTSGDRSNNYLETRSATLNAKWRITHSDKVTSKITLTVVANGENFTHDGSHQYFVNKDATKEITTRIYSSCINWAV
ncbi:hypothetical protein BGZ95_001360 [Linnemannia exigua]|uniref:Uncharacterized protein n=1 Tax=Linnemannia exigua TaxID=604196 RepID=A0AAD4H439_9FUNG|nr:hypothetical protein BGZ95_001360 [Linnemannia exigua]